MYQIYKYEVNWWLLENQYKHCIVEWVLNKIMIGFQYFVIGFKERLEQTL